ncbi:MAG: undecaprenyl-diphosphate phosphatase [Firmicutes bacterium]|jgi:undecaprenyl-diphosphatase|nr:undecaprenyl-diphosphate phosphatase [Bacillota bacterium]
MTIFEAVALGILQGLTEFLPVSSSGHLVIIQNLFNLKQPGVTFEVMVHFGTFLSIIWVFRSDIKELLLAPFKQTNSWFLILLIVGTIPAGVAGITLRDLFTAFFQSPFVAPIMLLVTGGLLWFVNHLPQKRYTIRKMSLTDALFIGAAQALAIIPGLSRSGSTITAALWRGLDRETAVRYSFLLSLPVIFGATLLEIGTLLESNSDLALWLPHLAGITAAFFSGIFAIKIFIQALRTKKFHVFAIYCWVIGFFVLFYNLISL